VRKDIFVGTYELCFEHIRLYLQSGSGANTDLLPSDKGVSIVKIGADVEKWSRVLSALIHEAQEISMTRLGYSYYPAQSMSNSTANFRFMMDHEQFDECCHRTADFLTPALPDLARAWKKWNAPKEKPAHPYLTRPFPRDYSTVAKYRKAMKRYNDTMPKPKNKAKK